jgi:hypothetical protein
MPAGGYVAMAFAVLVTLALGVGLMVNGLSHPSRPSCGSV